MEKQETVKARDDKKKVGEKLNNGAIIIQTNGIKVLAYKENTHEFVTWVFSPDGFTVSGHYFWHRPENKDEVFNEAVADYNERK